MSETGGRDAPVFGKTGLARQLWPHQERALAAFERDRREGDTATYLVVPPGGGKTLIGLEIARRLGRPTVVLCPNTAIQAQWVAQWQTAFAPVTVAATTSRDLPTPLTVLTYQAVSTLGATGNGDGRPKVVGPARRTAGSPAGDEVLSFLHPNGLELVSRLCAGGPWTVVLDECHHLLELWGRLLQVIIGKLGQPHVVGLTATPPHMMTTEQAALHQALFGRVDLEISAPALVREKCLAPYQELAYFARPTPAEADYIHGEAIRWAELRTGLLDPVFAATPFLEWLRTRVVERRSAEGAQVSWQRFEREEPELADAAVRLHTSGLLPLPEGARVREQHRHPPGAEDWVALIGDYCRRCLQVSGDPRDGAAYQAIRAALPAVGYRLTRAGVRAGESPVDRVLARSQGKARAVIEILRTEAAQLGPRLRALVLCDFEVAAGTLPAQLSGVLEAEAGGALLALQTLLEDPETAALGPVLMTGGRVACGPDTAGLMTGWLATHGPGLEITCEDRGPVTEITGGPGWQPRRYVPLITSFFADGGTRCLVGTRGLLGEGWDAPAVNVVVDLTAATTPTSVVQARGRALRRDESWPQKVADNWAVVCATDDHPKGAADYYRLVRKHDRYFALSPAGDIISGVTHIDPALSPYAPPPMSGFDALNAAMLERPAERAAVHERWRIGTPYQDEPAATVTITAGRAIGVAGRAAITLSGDAHRPWAAIRVALRLTRIPPQAGLEDIAVAAADALHATGRTSRGGEAVRLTPLPDGSYRAQLGDVSASESSVFATALDEVLSPLAQPRYVVPRLIITPPATRWEAVRLAVHRIRHGTIPAAVIYHAVPAVLGAAKRTATEFEKAWHAHVSPGAMLHTGSPEGAGILAAQRGDDPFAITTQIRTLWR